MSRRLIKPILFLTLVAGLLTLAAGLSLAQHDGQSGSGNGQSSGDPDPRLSKTQREAISTADRKKNLEDAAALVKLAGDLEAGIEKQDPYVISVKNIKQTEEIEKLAKKIRGRLNHN